MHDKMVFFILKMDYFFTGCEVVELQLVCFERLYTDDSLRYMKLTFK